jgi:O-antigen/teichoic acid export membrane protein
VPARMPLWQSKILPRVSGLRDYANNFGVEMLLNGLGLLSGILLARWLGPTGRGQLAAAMLWPTVIGIAISLGLQHAFTYAVGVGWAKPDTLQRWGAKFTLLVAVPAMIVYWIVAPSLLGKQFPEQEWVPGIFSLYIPLAVYAGFLFPLYYGTGDFARWNTARVFRNLAWTCGVVALAIVASLTVLNLLVIQIAVLVLLCVYLYSKLGKLTARIDGDGSAPLKLVVKYALAVHLSGMAYAINQQLDQLLLSVWVSPSDLGEYAAAATLSGVLLVIPGAISPIGLSKIARSNREPVEQRRHVRVVFLGTTILLVPCGLLLMLLAPWVTRVLFGSAFVQTPQVLRILTPAAVFFGTSLMLTEVLKGLGRPMYATWGTIVGAIITVVGLSWSLGRFGIWGAAWVSFTAYTVMALIQGFLLWRCMFRLRGYEKQAGR